jgi:hypothetical protein
MAFAGILFFLLWKYRRKTAKRLLILMVAFSLLLMPPAWIYRRAIIKKSKRALAILCSRNSTENAPDEDTENGNSCSCTWNKSGLNSDDYYAHLNAAKRLPQTKKVQDKSHLNDLDKQGIFEDVEMHPSLEVRKLEHSHAIVHESANESIRELSKRFREKLAGSAEEDARFIISSITRTVGQQKEIQRLYPNAVHGSGESAHCYGAAIDITGVKTSGNCSRARKILYKVLREMQKEDKILLMAESRCIHITFR